MKDLCSLVESHGVRTINFHHASGIDVTASTGNHGPCAAPYQYRSVEGRHQWTDRPPLFGLTECSCDHAVTVSCEMPFGRGVRGHVIFELLHSGGVLLYCYDTAGWRSLPIVASPGRPHTIFIAYSVDDDSAHGRSPFSCSGCSCRMRARGAV
nr:hypothetical protein CFP56_62172 [Quercus suber]